MDRQQFNVAQHTCAPLRLMVEEVVPISAETTFRALTDPVQMCRTFPWMHDVTIANGSELGLGATRRCHFGNGIVLEERIIGWWPSQGFAFRGLDENHPFGMRGHVGELWCEPNEAGCRLTWRHYFDHSNPAAMREKLLESVHAAVESLKHGSMK